MTLEHATDEELILRFQTGQEACLTVIYSRYKQPIFNFCLRILGNRADAEDVLSDVFLTLLSCLYKETSRAKFKTFLYTLAKNRCIDRLRRKKFNLSLWFQNESGAKENFLDPVDTSENTRDKLSSQETIKTVSQAILSLDIEKREALVLREYQKLSYEEIAVILEC